MLCPNNYYMSKIILSVLLLAGCAVGPNYHPIKLDTPSTWINQNKNAPHTQASIDSDWWTILNETPLNRLMNEALRDNPTLAQAVTRIEQARMDIRKENSFNLPALSMTASKNRTEYSSKDSNLSTYTPGANPLTSSLYSQTISNTALNLSWEFDVFGRVRRSVEAAKARLDSRIAEAASIKLALQAQIAENWLVLRVCEQLYDQFNQDTQSRLTIHALTGLRVKAGFAAPTEQTTSQLEAAQAFLQEETQASSCKQVKSTLIALTGIAAQTLDELSAETLNKTLPVPPIIAPDLPAVILVQRFDITLLERNLAAANAEIGLAEAAKYPSVSLATSLGKQWINTNGSDVELNLSTFGPSLTLPLFNGGRQTAAVRQAYARYEENKHALRERVRQAAKEIEQALIRFQSAQNKEKILEQGQQEAYASFQLAQTQFKSGSINQIEQETARHKWLLLLKDSTRFRLESLQAWISLIKAIGGAPDGSIHTS
jgi:outer membrane protein, multidrug efflux system